MLLAESGLLWPLLPDDAPAGADPEQWDQAQQAAIEWLWASSGRQFGTRLATYRPASLIEDRGAYTLVLPYLTSVYGSLWLDSLSAGCGYPEHRVLQLPGPAVAVVSVELTDAAGTTTALPASGYRLDGDWLVRVDGQAWPLTQDTVANGGAANTWAVTYQRGALVPVAGQVAASKLAREWLKLIAGDAGCRLPWNTTSVSRAGVTVQRKVDGATPGTMTGIEAVDRWVNTTNPSGLRSQPTIWTPDLPRGQGGYRGASLPYRLG